MYHEMKETMESLGEGKYERNKGQDAELFDRIEEIETAMYHKWKLYEVDINMIIEEAIQKVPKEGYVKDTTMRIEMKKVTQFIDQAEIERKRGFFDHASRLSSLKKRQLN